MPEPWEMTDEEIQAEAELLREEREQADREDAPLWARQMAEAAAEDELFDDLDEDDLDFGLLVPDVDLVLVITGEGVLLVIIIS